MQSQKHGHKFAQCQPEVIKFMCLKSCSNAEVQWKLGPVTREFVIFCTQQHMETPPTASSIFTLASVLESNLPYLHLDGMQLHDYLLLPVS